MNKKELIEAVTEDCANRVDTGRGSQTAILNMASVGHVLATAMPILATDLFMALNADPDTEEVLMKNPIHPMAKAVRRALRQSIIGREATKDQFQKPGKRR